MYQPSCMKEKGGPNHKENMAIASINDLLEQRKKSHFLTLTPRLQPY